MPITTFELSNFRLYEQASLHPDRRLTILVGANASGKTSLLEAIHLLSTGRTFRKANLEQLVRQGADGFAIRAEYQSMDGKLLSRLAVMQTREARQISINGSGGARQSELAQALPVLVVSPDSHFEFQQNARERRAVLDWTLFHVEHGFHDNWSRYQRTLAQRNSALKDRKYGRATFSWDDELAELGEALQSSRENCLSVVAEQFRSICAQLLPSVAGLELRLDAGWDKSAGLVASLFDDRTRDLARGFTHSGPHRSDLRILVDNKLSREKASHGQNKLLVTALRLAQIQYFFELTGRECCLLVDDLAAELDLGNRTQLVSYLAEMPVQVIITTTEAEKFSYRPWSSHKTFHVKQGVVLEVNNPEIRHQFA